MIDYKINERGRYLGVNKGKASLFSNCIQNDVTSQRLSRDVGSKNPDPYYYKKELF